MQPYNIKVVEPMTPSKPKRCKVIEPSTPRKQKKSKFADPMFGTNFLNVHTGKVKFVFETPEDSDYVLLIIDHRKKI